MYYNNFGSDLPLLFKLLYSSLCSPYVPVLFNDPFSSLSLSSLILCSPVYDSSFVYPHFLAVSSLRPVCMYLNSLGQYRSFPRFLFSSACHCLQPSLNSAFDVSSESPSLASSNPQTSSYFCLVSSQVQQPIRSLFFITCGSSILGGVTFLFPYFMVPGLNLPRDSQTRPSSSLHLSTPFCSS